MLTVTVSHIILTANGRYGPICMWHYYNLLWSLTSINNSLLVGPNSLNFSSTVPDKVCPTPSACLNDVKGFVRQLTSVLTSKLCFPKISSFHSLFQISGA